MADNTPIEWTDATVNAINGCTLVSEGCRHCYAARLAATRMKSHPTRAGLARVNAAGEAKFTGEVRLNEAALLQPLAWKRPRRIFWNAHGDTFQESVPDDWIDRMFAVCALTPQHTHQILTKRPERMREYVIGKGMPLDLADRAASIAWAAMDTGHLSKRTGAFFEAIGCEEDVAPVLKHWPLPNVWLGTSVEDQATADLRIPELLATPAAVRFVSMEPLLGPVDLTLDNLACKPCPRCGDGSPDPETGLVDCRHCDGTGKGDDLALDWIIVGSESGPKARHCDIEWVRSIRDQCVAVDVPLLWKQHVVGGRKIGLPELDGRIWKEFPRNVR